MIEVRHEALGLGSPKIETVYVLAETDADAFALVRTGLRLDDQAMNIVRTLTEAEWKGMGLKPFQVKHA